MINGELVVDLFAGGGGASTGIEVATGYGVDVAINHDPAAILQHQMNHPGTKHYCSDVREVDPVKACAGRPVGLLWASPDCKHFSKAKGGKPKDKKTRGLGWMVVRWAALARPRVIMLENVEEFTTWGPLNRQRHPIQAKKGQTFQKFVKQLEDLGYVVEWRTLCAADYGAPTMRRRLALVARRDGRPIVWPEPTHAPAGSTAVRAGVLQPYVGAHTQIDFSLPCPSIFDTAEEIKERYGIKAVRPLAENTMQRIARGVKKFVLDNPEPFIIPIGYGERKGQMPRTHDVKEPLPTVVGSGKHYLVSPVLIQYHSETSRDCVRGQCVQDPIMTVDGSNRYGLVSAFIQKYYAGETRSDASDLSKPLHTVTGRNGQSLVAATLVQMNNHCDGRDITEPIPTITAGPGHFWEVRAFLVKYYGNGTGQDVKDPLGTVTAQDRFGLVKVKGVDYQIVDIGMRMLEPKELYGCQGFPEDYIIDRDPSGKPYPRSEQVKRCGNSVPPPFAAALVRANLPEICVAKRTGNMRIVQEQTGQLMFA